MKYYGLISGLPGLKIMKPAQPPVKELRSLLDQYTEGRDAEIIYHFFYQWDLTNCSHPFILCYYRIKLTAVSTVKNYQPFTSLFRSFC